MKNLNFFNDFAFLVLRMEWVINFLCLYGYLQLFIIFYLKNHKKKKYIKIEIYGFFLNLKDASLKHFFRNILQ